jgi:hypothetical protein
MNIPKALDAPALTATASIQIQTCSGALSAKYQLDM